MNPTPSDFGKSSQATAWRAVPIYPTQRAYIQTMRNPSAAHRLFFPKRNGRRESPLASSGGRRAFLLSSLYWFCFGFCLFGIALFYGQAHRVADVAAVVVDVGVGRIEVEVAGVDGVAVVARRGRPIAAAGTNEGNIRTVAVAGARQKNGASSFHLTPFGSRVAVHGEVARVGSEYQPAWCAPSIGKKDVTSLSIDSRLTSELLGIVAGAEEVIPLIVRQRTPHTSLVAAVADGIVNTPVVIGAGNIT